MLRHIIFFLALILWIASILDSSLGNMIYFVWGMAFLLSIYGYSLFFSSLAFLTSLSYFFIDSSSSSFFFATLLPWVFGVLTTWVIFLVGIRYLSYRTIEYTHHDSDIHEQNTYKQKVWFFF